MNLENLAIQALMVQNDFSLDASHKHLVEDLSDDGELIIWILGPAILFGFAHYWYENLRRNKDE